MERDACEKGKNQGDAVTDTELVLFQRSPIHGLGGFARAPIRKGTRIFEYVGERISKSESLRRCAQDNGYIFSLNAEQDLDGSVAWNPARFINHSCAPNCEAEMEDERIWIVAARDIAPGEEITFNYGYDLADYQDHPCRCGSANCVGYMVAEEFFEHVLRRKKSLGAQILATVLAAVLTVSCATRTTSAAKDNRCAFMGITDFSSFTKSPGPATNETTLLSREIIAPIEWDELVVSWNVPAGVHLKAEARAMYPDRATQYYTMGLWSDDPEQFPRESVRRQRDQDGTVRTDTLILSNATRKVQLRITVGGAGGQPPLKFLGLSFCNSTVPATALAPNRAAWGKVLDVPERRQGEYEGGGGWCSPTSLSMVLAYWSERLHRPELNRTVPETARAIADGRRGDTGNWPFNTAYAGHYPGMRAYVTRLGDIAELEDWIAAGIPVIISVSSYLTSDRISGPDAGHLIVCVGFTDKGDVVTNDPGVSVRRNVRARRVYGRAKVVNAWKKSKNTVYLTYPETVRIPANRLGHWD